jgi:hypothetical protein
MRKEVAHRLTAKPRLPSLGLPDRDPNLSGSPEPDRTIRRPANRTDPGRRIVCVLGAPGRRVPQRDDRHTITGVLPPPATGEEGSRA